MDENYRRIYRDLLDHYKIAGVNEMSRRNFARPGSDREVFIVIEKVISDFKQNNRQYDLRPDAEYFLFLNFYQMIALPLLWREYRAIDPPGSILLAIAHDTEFILGQAIEEAHEKEISGHSIVQSLSKSWEKLKTTEYKLWNRHN